METGYLDLRVMCYSRLSILRRYHNLKNSERILFHRVRFSAPVIYLPLAGATAGGLRRREKY